MRRVTKKYRLSLCVRCVAVSAVALLLVAPSARGGFSGFADLRGEDAGQVIYTFLTLPLSASDLGSGCVGAPVVADATAAATAPAATAFFERYQFAATHLEWLMGLRKEHVGACFPLLDVGTLGFCSQLFTLGGIENAKDIDENDVDPKAAEMSVGVSFARQLLPTVLSVGVVVSYVESHLAGDAARSFNAGVDAVFRPFARAEGHLYARHMGPPVRYNSTPEMQPWQTGLTVAFFPLARPDTADFRNIDLTLGAGVQKGIDGPLRIGASVDVELIRRFHLRTGYEYAPGQDPSAAGLSAGVGLDVKQYGMDAGWRYQSPEFGSVWAVTARYSTREMVPRTAIDYYKLASRFFRKEHYRRCIMYAAKALRLNPNMWRAHALIARAFARIHRAEGNEIVLIYTGNVKGRFTPTRVEGVSMGGLARQLSVINQLREEYPISIAVDAGNLITHNSHPLRVGLARYYHERAKYEVAAVGAGEDAIGLEQFREERGPHRKFLCTDCPHIKAEYVVNKQIVSAGRHKVAFLSLLPGHMQEQTTFAHSPALIDLMRELQSDDVTGANLRVLVIHDSWKTVKQHAEYLPNVDFVLCGSEPQRFEAPMKIGGASVLSTGEFGKYVGALTLRFDDNRKLASYENRLIPLTGDIVPDPLLEQRVHQIAVQVDLEEQGIIEGAVGHGTIDGAFPFVSDRKDVPHIYLKVVKGSGEFPLTFGERPCSQPRLSRTTGRILYLCENDSVPGTDLMIMDVTGARKRQLPTGGTVTDATFSPDGAWVYAAAAARGGDDTDIYRLRTAGGEAQRVTGWSGSSERAATFSPDGQTMLFLSDRDETWQVYVCDLAGEKPVRLTDVAADHAKPLFSPDGRFVTYLSEKNNFDDRMDLWIYDRSNGEEIRATRLANVRDYCWIDSAGTMLYSSGANLVELNTVNVLTGESDKLVVTGYPKEYSETSPTVVYFEGQKYIAYTRDFGAGKKEIFWVRPDGTNDRKIVFGFGQNWLE